MYPVSRCRRCSSPMAFLVRQALPSAIHNQSIHESQRAPFSAEHVNHFPQRFFASEGGKTAPGTPSAEPIVRSCRRSFVNKLSPLSPPSLMSVIRRLSRNCPQSFGRFSGTPFLFLSCFSCWVRPPSPKVFALNHQEKGPPPPELLCLLPLQKSCQIKCHHGITGQLPSR